jgi:hypothetical protein
VPWSIGQKLSWLRHPRPIPLAGSIDQPLHVICTCLRHLYQPRTPAPLVPSWSCRHGHRARFTHGLATTGHAKPSWPRHRVPQPALPLPHSLPWSSLAVMPCSAAVAGKVTTTTMGARGQEAVNHLRRSRCDPWIFAGLWMLSCHSIVADRPPVNLSRPKPVTSSAPYLEEEEGPRGENTSFPRVLL